MPNNPINNPSAFQRGQPLSAAQLNQVVQALVKRIQGANGIQVQGNGQNIMISYNSPVPRGVTDVVLATITSEVGSGVYNWEKYSGSGPASGQATELNLSTGIVANTVVVCHRKAGVWYFFFPVEEC